MSLDANQFPSLFQPRKANPAVRGGSAWDTGLGSVAPAAPAVNAPAASAGDTFSTSANTGDPRQSLLAILQSGVGQGLVGQHQVRDLSAALGSLNAGQLASIQGLLASASQPVEQVFILKAFAAGENWTNLVQYAGEMRGQDPQAIIAKSTVRKGQDLIQQWQDACAPTVAETAAGDADPRFAWELNKLGDITKIDPHGQDQALAQQQAQWLQAYGGSAVDRGQAGGTGIAMNKILNDMIGPVTHASYNTVAVADAGGPAAALDQISASLKDGYDVPLRLSWNTPSSGQDSGHFVLAMAVSGEGANRQLQLHDPWTGTTQWVSEANILNNSFQPIFGQYARLTHFYAPQPTAP